jgi:hypothetical protein
MKFHRIFAPNRFKRGEKFVGAGAALLCARASRFLFVHRQAEPKAGAQAAIGKNIQRRQPATEGDRIIKRNIEDVGAESMRSVCAATKVNASTGSSTRL